MSRIRSHAARKLGELIASRVAFALPPIIVAAPPSAQSVYPALAILIDSTEFNFSMDDLVECDSTLSVGEQGFITDGFYATDANGNLAPNAVPFISDDGRGVSHIGTINCKGRLWVGSRNPTQREQLEDDVAQLFFDDDAAPGRILFDISGATVGGLVIPFGTGCAEIDRTSWDAEHAFDERLWSFMQFLLDVPLVVPRNAPLSTTLILAITSDLDFTPSSVADLDQLSDLRQFTVDGSGDTEPFEP